MPHNPKDSNPHIHPHSPRQDPTHLYVIMPFLPGGDLRSALRRVTRMEEGHVRFYAAQMISGLSHLHAKDILYRDMKPANLLVDSDGNIMLSDYGISIQLKGSGSTAKGNPGTPGYRAPEVCAHVRYGVSCDWWSFGITLYVLLHGSKLFEREHEKPLARASLDMHVDDSRAMEFEELVWDNLDPALSQQVCSKSLSSVYV